MNGTQDLINTNEYVVIAFTTTTRALKAEKALKASRAEFITIPTPREVSTSCGIAVKLHPDNRSCCERLLINAGIEIGGIYRVNGNGKNMMVARLEPEYQLPA